MEIKIIHYSKLTERIKNLLPALKREQINSEIISEFNPEQLSSLELSKFDQKKLRISEISIFLKHMK